MADLIIIAVLSVILGLAAWYVIRVRKSGKKCIGCPYSKNCAQHGPCNCRVK